MTAAEDADAERTRADELAAAVAELQATAQLLARQLGDVGRASTGAALEHAPSARRLLDLAPPELRGRLQTAAEAGLGATRDLADWLLGQLQEDERPAVGPLELPIKPLSGRRIGTVATTWILTASVENHEATAATDFSVIGIKERNHRRALEIEAGDVLVLYLTKVKAFAGAVRVAGEMVEDRAKIWPGKPGSPDPYPWRFATEPLVVLPRERWVPADGLRDSLEHVRKWPEEHWTLAFQGQLRAVSEADAALLMRELDAAAAAVA